MGTCPHLRENNPFLGWGVALPQDVFIRGLMCSLLSLRRRGRQSLNCPINLTSSQGCLNTENVHDCWGRGRNSTRANPARQPHQLTWPLCPGSCPTAWKVPERARALLGKTHAPQSAKASVIENDLGVASINSKTTTCSHGWWTLWVKLLCARTCLKPFRNNIPFTSPINSMR